MRILSFETSCDETAVAVVKDGRTVESSVVRSQIETHRLYGGVVPEIASRAHIESISRLTQEALALSECKLSELDAIAVTAWPGLIGSLVVGVNYAKSLAYAANLPLIPVHHLRGHIASVYLADASVTPPFLCLIVSGGHTGLVWVRDYTWFETLGTTRDDAAGECLDKVARVLGLPYPGGIALDRASQTGNETAFTFPEGVVRDAPFDFSFSGVKTAASNQINMLRQKGTEPDLNDFAASLLHSVTDTLCSRLERAAVLYKADIMAVVGGVAANSMLRAKALSLADRMGIGLILPDPSLCGDNAAMIGAQGYYEFLDGNTADATLNARASMELGDVAKGITVSPL